MTKTCLPKMTRTCKKEKNPKLPKKKGLRLDAYIYKVLKEVHPEFQISKQAMSIMDSMISDIYERLAFEASKLMVYNKKVTLQARDIKIATRLVLPKGELVKHALTEGMVAIQRFFELDPRLMMKQFRHNV